MRSGGLLGPCGIPAVAWGMRGDTSERAFGSAVIDRSEDVEPAIAFEGKLALLAVS